MLDEGGYPLDPYNEVIPGLFQADTTLTPEEMFAAGFDVVFDLCGWNRGADPGGSIDRPYVFHQIDDVPWIDDPDALHELAATVASEVRAGKRVAVNCMSGMNRSGLLVARTLIELGYVPSEAVERVRRARGPHALSNREFARWLLIDCTPRRLAARRSADSPGRRRLRR